MVFVQSFIECFFTTSEKQDDKIIKMAFRLSVAKKNLHQLLKCVCVCVCVYVREREGGGEGAEGVCVCVYFVHEQE